MTGQAAKQNRACARLEREDRSEMKRYFCASLLLVLFALAACEGAPSPVTADSQSGGFAASDRSAEGCAHESVTDPKAAPTCTEPGRTEGTHFALRRRPDRAGGNPRRRTQAVRRSAAGGDLHGGRLRGGIEVQRLRRGACRSKDIAGARPHDG